MNKTERQRRIAVWLSKLVKKDDWAIENEVTLDDINPAFGALIYAFQERNKSKKDK